MAGLRGLGLSEASLAAGQPIKGGLIKVVLA